MNFEWYIAKRLFKQNKDNALNKTFANTQPIIRIAVIAIALSLSVMIVSVAILKGFQSEIKNKVSGFGGHIVISNYTNNNSYETAPISKNQAFVKSIKEIKGVKNVQVYATKAGIIKTDTDIAGVVLKGIDKDFDWNFFNNKIVEGKSFTISDTAKSNSAIISKQIADRLKLKVGDNLVMHFIQQPPRSRKFTICGIYKTGLEDFDKTYVFADIKHIQKLNNWDSSKVAGFEVMLNNFENTNVVREQVYDNIGSELNAQTIREIYPQLFDWLDLQDINVQIILILMLLVGIINMASALLIMILERTNFIGILKALGAKNGSIRKIFLYNATYLIGKGMFWGNLMGIGLCALQYKFHFVKLDEESYYVSYIPILLNPLYVLGLNAGTLIICVLVLIIPSYIITRISPVRAIRFT